MSRFTGVLIIILSIVIVWLYLSKNRLESKLVKDIENTREQLLELKDSLAEENEALRIDNIVSIRKIDSLKVVKSKIHYKYVLRKKEINSINDVDSLRLLLTNRYKSE